MATERDKRARSAVLVLPDIGLDESQVDKLKQEFQNNLVSSIKKAKAGIDISVEVRVTIVF